MKKGVRLDFLVFFVAKKKKKKRYEKESTPLDMSDIT